jgi:hypothetical protein
MDRCDRAWAAGFFDGEGWANATGGRRRRTRQPYAQINQAGADGPPEVLLRFREVVGVGRVAIGDADANLYRWTASSRGDVATTFEVLAPWLGIIKRRQFGRALNVNTAEEIGAEMRAADEELAWAAGLFDGEGSVYLLRHRTHDGYLYVEAALTQSGLVLPEVLTRFEHAVGYGRIYGPYPAEEPWLPVYRWKASRRPHVEDLVIRLRPWLGSVKRTQAEHALSAVSAQPRLPRGNPSWGSHKSHCIRGHEYAVARIRPFVSRRGGTQRRDSKQCLVCVREQARTRRQLQRRG